MSKKTVTTTTPKRKRTTPATRKTTKKKATAARTVRKAKAELTSDRRHAMIAQAAYFVAEARGFEPGQDVADWLTAERKIDAQL